MKENAVKKYDKMKEKQFKEKTQSKNEDKKKSKGMFVDYCLEGAKV